MQQLRARGPMRSGPLAALCDTDTTTLMPCLSTALKFGAVVRSGARGDFTWALGDGKPAAPAAEPDDDPLVREVTQRSVPAAGQRLPDGILAAIRGRRGKAWTQPEELGAAAPTPASVTPAAEVASASIAVLEVGNSTPATEESPPVQELAKKEGDAQDLLHTSASPIASLEVPCIQLTTLSFTVTPHQAERICAFVRTMTEVRP
jgi:hypothetical protein